MKIKRISMILTAILFSAMLLVFCLLTIFLPKKTISESERRKLAKLPEFSLASLLDRAYFDGLSDYITDHFALREEFRTMNAAVRTDILRQPDVNGVFEENGYLFEPKWPPDPRAVTLAAEKMQNITDTYFAGKPVYFSIIPDKSDFAQQASLRLDTENVVQMVSEHFTGQYIDITDTLELSDYYRTDTHWRQEHLEDTVSKLVSGMGGTLEDTNFEFQTVEPFYGVLWGRYAMPLPAETIVYGTNEATENAVVRYLDHPDTNTVYLPEITSPDKYDLFLSGASSLIEIESPAAKNDRHLVLFRDSFGSSLAPWLLTQYGKITIIDIRYIASSEIGKYADLKTADEVLFLYSTSILNTGGILK